jgi:hypothetical protein
MGLLLAYFGIAYIDQKCTNEAPDSEYYIGAYHAILCCCVTMFIILVIDTILYSCQDVQTLATSSMASNWEVIIGQAEAMLDPTEEYVHAHKSQACRGDLSLCQNLGKEAGKEVAYLGAPFKSAPFESVIVVLQKLRLNVAMIEFMAVADVGLEDGRKSDAIITATSLPTFEPLRQLLTSAMNHLEESVAIFCNDKSVVESELKQQRRALEVMNWDADDENVKNAIASFLKEVNGKTWEKATDTLGKDGLAQISVLVLSIRLMLTDMRELMLTLSSAD